MRSFARYPVLVWSGVAILGGLGSAEAAPWSLFSGSNSQDGGPPSVAAAPAPSGDAPTRLAAIQHFRDGSYTGPAADAYYGVIQVRANIQGRRLVHVDVLQYPADRRASRRINGEALPSLDREVIRAQSARVDGVSGATLTSRAYLRSLSGALAEASK